MTSIGAQAKVRDYLARYSEFKAVYAFTKQRFKASHLLGHNWEHAYRDLINAIVIGEAEGADMSVVLPAAVMHDIGFLYGAASQDHGAAGADRLPEFLREGGINLDRLKLQHIADCIRTHKGNIHGEAPVTL